MHINIPASILGLKGQCVNSINCNSTTNTIRIECRRDKRKKAKDPISGKRGIVNCYVHRTIADLPILSHRVEINIELAQVLTKDNRRLIELCEFVDKGCYYTKRFCRLVSGLCRHMTISAVSKHFKLRWETVKNMDKQHLQDTLPALDPSKLTNLKYLGVDEVARAKGHDYMTVVYDLESGQLIWVHEGRTAEIFSMFLKQLPEATKQGILAVAMDMGPAYQKSVKNDLPNADIIFDRFHVMQNFGRAIDNQRRIEFRKADKVGKELITGTRYLLLKNQDKLDEKQQNKLNKLLQENQNMSILYILKEQLQALWTNKTYESMESALENWCQMADQTNMAYMKKFAKSLRRYKVGICNYAKHPLTTARIEAGNVGIGLIRKRARGIRDTEYFKLKIRQLSVPEEAPMFYKSTS
jgi:transposase